MNIMLRLSDYISTAAAFITLQIKPITLAANPDNLRAAAFSVGIAVLSRMILKVADFSINYFINKFKKDKNNDIQ